MLLPHTVDDRLHWNWTDNVSRGGGLFTRIVSQYLADRALLSCQLPTFSRSMHWPVLLTVY